MNLYNDLHDCEMGNGKGTQRALVERKKKFGQAKKKPAIVKKSHQCAGINFVTNSKKKTWAKKRGGQKKLEGNFETQSPPSKLGRFDSHPFQTESEGEGVRMQDAWQGWESLTLAWKMKDDNSRAFGDV